MCACQISAASGSWYSDPQWVAVVVALLLGVIGIFQDKIRSFFIRPILNPTISLKPPDCHKIELTYPDDGRFICNTYYMRFRVENSGTVQLQNAEAMVTRLWRYLDSEDDYVLVEIFLPINLRWAHKHNDSMPIIQPKAFKHCDFAHLLSRNQYSDAILRSRNNPEALLQLDTFVTPNTMSNILNPGKYKIEVLFSASNTTAVKKLYYLEFENYWSEDEEDMLNNRIKMYEV